MFNAVGIDIIDLDRLQKTVLRWGDRFLKRILTANEMAYCKSKANGIHSMAARFAAKEAFIKCLSSLNVPSFSWQEMEVLNRENGQPYVVLHKDLANRLKDYRILISLSHTATSAVAIIILENKGDMSS